MTGCCEQGNKSQNFVPKELVGFKDGSMLMAGMLVSNKYVIQRSDY